MTLALTLPQTSITYVHGHVEVISFKGVGHLAKALQSVFPGSLLKAKGFRGAFTLRHDTLWAPPDTLRNLRERWQQAKDVVVVITAITQQKFVVLIPAGTHPAYI